MEGRQHPGESEPLSPSSLRQRRLLAFERGSTQSQSALQIKSELDGSELQAALAMSLQPIHENPQPKKRKPRTNQETNSDIIDLCACDDDIVDLSKSPAKKAPRKMTKSVARQLKPKSPVKKAADKRVMPSANRVSYLSVATYNIWFGPPHPFERMSAISSALSEKCGRGEDLPMFVGFQEVTPELSQMLFPLLESRGYQNICQDLTSIGYGCSISIQKGCKIIGSGFVPYKTSVMGRGIVWALAQLKDSDREVLFTTTHLESFMRNYPSQGETYDGVKERELQIKELELFCKECMERRPAVDAAFITGDLNWDDERKRSDGNDKPLLSVLSNTWSDAWKETRPREEGYTYDSKENEMLKGNLRRRFDRCLVLRNEPQMMSIEQTYLIGKDPIPGKQWKKEARNFGSYQTKATVVPVVASDHFGLLVKMKIET